MAESPKHRSAWGPSVCLSVRLSVLSGQHSSSTTTVDATRPAYTYRPFCLRADVLVSVLLTQGVWLHNRLHCNIHPYSGVKMSTVNVTYSPLQGYIVVRPRRQQILVFHLVTLYPDHVVYEQYFTLHLKILLYCISVFCSFSYCTAVKKSHLTPIEDKMRVTALSTVL